MTTKVEYLAIFPRTDSFCDTCESLLRLLQVDSRITVSSDAVIYDGKAVCRLQLANGEVVGRGQRYFRLAFTWDGDPDFAGDSLSSFLGALRAVRAAVAQAGGDVETLWDDLSAHYARISFPLIQEIESLMRRLIADFMLVTVGREWVTETLPHEVAEAVKKSKRKGGPKDYLNILHTVDFIHLGDFLFAQYSSRGVQELYTQIKNTKTPIDAATLRDFLPTSNWHRYFRALASCDDSYLRSRWEKLYDLRCKVAHNALMTADDVKDIQTLTGEVKPKLEEAIEKIGQVTVPPEDAERVAENAARGIHSTIGEFITKWQQVESVIDRRMQARGIMGRRIPNAAELIKVGILDSEHGNLYDSIRRFRNALVHGPATAVPAEMIRDYIVQLGTLASEVENVGYAEYLHGLSEEDQRDAIEAKLDQNKHILVDSPEVSDQVAETNACGWDIDEILVNAISFDIPEGICSVQFSFKAVGEPEPDKMYCGSEIEGEAEAIINSDGDLEFENVSASVVDDRDPEDSDE